VHELREQRVLDLDRDLQPFLSPKLRNGEFSMPCSALNRAVVPIPSSLAIFSGSTSIDQSRSVDAFHCEVFAFS